MVWELREIGGLTNNLNDENMFHWAIVKKVTGFTIRLVIQCLLQPDLQQRGCNGMWGRVLEPSNQNTFSMEIIAKDCTCPLGSLKEGAQEGQSAFHFL